MVVGGLDGQLVRLGPGRVVVQQLVVPALDGFVDEGEMGNDPPNWLEDCRLEIVVLNVSMDQGGWIPARTGPACLARWRLGDIFRPPGC